MARTRAQRSRHTVGVAVAVVVTLLALVFARDVARSAHGAVGPRRSENVSFGALANSLLTQENEFDLHLDSLLTQADTLSRVVFAARLTQLNHVLTGWSTQGDLLSRPALAHDINQTIDTLTDERVAAYQAMLADVARTLELPWPTTPGISGNPGQILVSTSEQWNHDRFALAKEPGRVHLVATSAASAKYFVAHGTSLVSQSASLELVRAVSIDAIRVHPSAFPAPRGVMLLPPVRSVQLGVSVLNASFDDQPVTLSVRVTPLNGLGQPSSQTMSATLGPDGAYAFVPAALVTSPSERATLVIRVSGARAARGRSPSRSFDWRCHRRETRPGLTYQPVSLRWTRP